MNDTRGAIILILAFGSLLALAEAWSRIKSPHPEGPRKLVHLGGALIALFFPLLVQNPWLIGAMAVCFSAIFELGRRLHMLTCLHRVTRSTRGSEYYPLAIWMLSLLAADDFWRYVSSVLVLGLADAAAALVGSRYGRHFYRVEDENKSLEGSLAFFGIALLAIALPAFLLSDLTPAVIIPSAILVAILVTGFESFSLRGTDNLFVPIAACAILGKITSKPVPEIIYQNLSLVAMVTTVALVIWQTRWMHISGGVVLVWVAYAAWSLGSEWWALPILTGFVAYVLVRLIWSRHPHDPLRIHTVIRPALIPLLILIIDNQHFAHEEGLPTFLAACVIVNAYAVTRRAGREAVGQPSFGLRLSLALLSAAMVFVPQWLLGRLLVSEIRPALAASSAGLCILLFFPPRALWSARHFFLVIAVSIGSLLGKLIG